MDLGLSGLASGFDWKTFLDQMVEVERAPEARLLTEQNTLTQKKTAYASIKTQLATLQTRVDALKDPSLFDSRSITLQDATKARPPPEQRLHSVFSISRFPSLPQPQS